MSVLKLMVEKGVSVQCLGILTVLMVLYVRILVAV
jgi:hypothetical protein